MAVNKMEIQDENGNIYYPHTSNSIVFDDLGFTALDYEKYNSMRFKQNSQNMIRVATFNTLSMRDGYAAIRKYLIEKGVNIIGFQEVDYIADYQNMKVADIDYIESFPTGYSPKPNFGQMLTTMFNITGSEKFNMPDSTSEPRCVSRSIFNFNGKKVSFYLTHLNASTSDVDRTSQKAFILNLMDNDPNPYKILVGDFNFKSKTNFDDFIGHGYKIANGKDGKWFETYKGSDAGTWGNGALDNIIVSSNIDIVNVEMETNSLQKSDHNLLFADLVFTDKTEPVKEGLKMWVDGKDGSNAAKTSVWKDKSGNGNDINLYNFAYNNESGWVNGGLRHTRSANYIRLKAIPQVQSFELVFSKHYFGEQRDGIGILVSDDNYGQNQSISNIFDFVILYCYYSSKSGVYDKFAIWSDNQSSDVNTNYVVPPNNKIHMVINFPDLSHVQVYVNGVDLGTFPLPKAMNDFKFGFMTGTYYNYGSNKPYTSCNYYTLRMYDRPLSSLEVVKNMMYEM